MRYDIVISRWEAAIAQLIVRNLDEDTKNKLQRRARRRGRSTDEEVREILRAGVAGEDEDRPSPPLGTSLKSRFAGFGLEEEIPELRGQPAKPSIRGRLESG